MYRMGWLWQNGQSNDIPMKRLLFLVFALNASSSYAQVNPGLAEQCKDTRSFMGCVNAFTMPSSQPENGLSALRNAMKESANRLVIATNIENSERDFQPVVNQLASVEPRHPNSLAVKNARLAIDLFDAFKVALYSRINAEKLVQNKDDEGRIYNCEVLKTSADKFDQAYGFSIGWSYPKGAFGRTTCKVPIGSLPEDYIRKIVNRVLLEGSTSPYELAVNRWGEDFDSQEILKRLRYGWQ